MAHIDNSKMRAVVVDETAPARLALTTVERPTPKPGEALVRVETISLNRGEVKTAQTAAAGWRPGWDFAGVVEEAAANGAGPAAGTRVVGLAAGLGAWCEFIASPPIFLASLPDAVSFETAATLPVAGLTAYYCLAKGTGAAGERVLITGASGGVGVYALQLAAASGAEVTAAIRRPENEALARRLGAQNVAIGETLAADLGPFDLILESVGGDVLGAAMTMLAPGGTCVVFGASENAFTTFDGSKFRAGGASLYGFVGAWELQRQPPSQGLAHLAELAATGKLLPIIERRAPITDIGRQAQDLLDRRFVGKAVLSFADG